MQRLTNVVCQSDVEQVLATYQTVDTFDFAQLSSLAERYAEKYGVSRFTMNFFVLVVLVPRLEAFYEQFGIEKIVAEETIGDLHYKYNECVRVHSVDGVSAWDGCDFKIGLSICARTVPKTAVQVLLATGRSPKLRGFISKTGRTFDGALVLREGEAVFDFASPKADKTAKKKASKSASSKKQSKSNRSSISENKVS